MSTDSSTAPTRRVEAADDGDLSSQSAAISPRDLADLAAAIDRIEALIVSDAVAGSDVGAAVERIADIAFVLHERDVEASLCDALDAAVREIADANARQQASAQRIRQAAALLRQLSRSMKVMIALCQAAAHSGSPAAADAGPHSNASDDSELEAIAAAGSMPGDDAEVHGVAAESLIEPSGGAEQTGRAGNADPVSSAADMGSHAASEAEPGTAPRPPRLLDPYEDPGDLFESTAAAPAGAKPDSRDLVSPAEPSLAPTPPVPRPADDPLAPIMALSEEEMIALFS